MVADQAERRACQGNQEVAGLYINDNNVLVSQCDTQLHPRQAIKRHAFSEKGGGVLTTRKGERRREVLARLVVRKHGVRVGLALGGV